MKKLFFTLLIILSLTSQAHAAASIVAAFSNFSCATGTVCTGPKVDAGKQGTNQMQIGGSGGITVTTSKAASKPAITIGLSAAAARAVQGNYSGVTIRASDAVFKGPWVDVRAYGATGNGTTDDTAAIQAAIDQYANSSGAIGRVILPSGRYKITSTIYVRSHVILQGMLSDSNGPGVPGTEIAWYGADGGTAVMTAQDDLTDWSRSGIENVRIKNRAVGMTTGWGLKVRNPQNGAYLRHVYVDGFPSRQVLAYEASGRSGTIGATPGVFLIEDLFAMGGIIPVEIQSGLQPIDINLVTINTDATSTKGMFFTKGADSQPQAAPITVRSCAVEIPASGPDIHGFEWDSDLAISFNGCAVQRDDANGANLSTKSGFHYSYASRSLPTAELTNCTTWKMKYKYSYDRLGLNAAVLSRDVPESFGWRRNATDAVYPFTLTSVSAGLTASVAYASGDVLAGAYGVNAAVQGIITGVSASYTGTISTANDLTVGVYINGTLTGTVHISNSSPIVNAAVAATGRHDWHDLTANNEIQSWFLFAAGDQIQVKVTTGAGFVPTGGHLNVQVAVRFR